ncbi:MAG: hypothetical protein SNH35_06240 [Rikenellaceae bacterium]
MGIKVKNQSVAKVIKNIDNRNLSKAFFAIIDKIATIRRIKPQKSEKKMGLYG